ncbi:ABC transporter ATP-binding protein [Evansella cellulosilytica]|uniref:ABC transporter related protein n=1 Tax=Evansella cellulosilytica (strain ATCC 21833 / DSM 2522 / FERM P-1141 / JCM 9156 / N-4) TaxID=649639 RepID=E6TQJ6_EVAC2|nr:ABC transporter related protein [Evansella cellulosilytica DSM 2522]
MVYISFNSDVILEIRGLSKSFGSKKVLSNIDLTIKKGEIIGYIGPNGAGKSTTVKIMLGLIDQYQGAIHIFGQSIANNHTYKARIGYVPETADIYENLTAYEYLMFIGGLYGLDQKDIERKAERLVELLGIKEAYNTRITSFSKGMKQKVLIIASLLHNPDLLFLDEPLSGLDANSVMIVKEILAQLASEGKTIFYSSHIMDVVEKISHRIVLLQDGKLVADGSFEELKGHNMEGTLEEIFNQLTGFNEHKQIAENFVSIVKEG